MTKRRTKSPASMRMATSAGQVQHQREALVEFAGEEVDLHERGEEVGLEP